MVTPPPAAALPDRLVARDQWVCWRTHQRDNTPTKVPIVPGTTQFASTTDPETWRAFSTAREAVAATDVDGLGFVFTAEDPFVGVDLDACRDSDTETPAEWASAVISDLESYTEVSPSGTGYHVLVEADLPEGRNRAGDIELYDRSRFFTVTGDHVAVTPTTIEARDEALAAVHATRVAADTGGSAAGDATRTATASDAAATDSTADSDTAHPTADSDTIHPSADSNSDPAATTGPASLSDDELLERARTAANGEKFTRLWDGSTTSYPSHSEADMALCSLLAFWTGGDRARIDRLFRQSGLYREKWDEVHYADGTTYGAKTVARAVQRVDETYTPGDSHGSEATPTASATDAAATASAPAAASPAETEASPSEQPPASSPPDPPPTAEPPHPPQAEAYLDRIDELTARIDSLVAENDRLRAELAAAREEQPADSEPEADGTAGWWPFS